MRVCMGSHWNHIVTTTLPLRRRVRGSTVHRCLARKGEGVAGGQRVRSATTRARTRVNPALPLARMGYIQDCGCEALSLTPKRGGEDTGGEDQAEEAEVGL